MSGALADLLELSVVVDPTYNQNCYVLHRRDSDAVLLIDPGLQNQAVLRLLERQRWRCERILLTHGHGDHVNGVPAIQQEHGCPAALHPLDVEQLMSIHFLPGLPEDLPDVVCEEELADGQLIDFHGLQIGVMHTPGHTRGSVCLLVGADLLSGDTLFRRGVGRADLPGGNWDDLVRSIESRLYPLPEGTRVHPGHGGATTIGEEAQLNPFVVHPRYR